MTVHLRSIYPIFNDSSSKNQGKYNKSQGICEDIPFSGPFSGEEFEPSGYFHGTDVSE